MSLIGMDGNSGVLGVCGYSIQKFFFWGGGVEQLE